MGAIDEPEYGAGSTVPLAVVWDGHRWAQTAFPDVTDHGSYAFLTSVSCTPRTGGTATGPDALYCLALGQYYSCGASGDIEICGDNGPLTAVWNGTRWRVLERPDPSCDALGCLRRDHAECTSFRHCHALGNLDGTHQSPGGGSQAVIWTWNGSRWGHVPVEDGLTDLSCWSDTHCLAVGQVEPSRVDGVRIARGDLVSCHDAGSCLVTDGDLSHLISAHGTVTHHLRQPSTHQLRDVACPQRGYCLVVGRQAHGPGQPLPARRRAVRRHPLDPHPTAR